MDKPSVMGKYLCSLWLTPCIPLGMWGSSQGILDALEDECRRVVTYDTHEGKKKRKKRKKIKKKNATL